LAKKRSLHIVNEHFEPVFNAARGCLRSFASTPVETPNKEANEAKVEGAEQVVISRAFLSRPDALFRLLTNYFQYGSADAIGIQAASL